MFRALSSSTAWKTIREDPGTEKKFGGEEDRRAQGHSPHQVLSVPRTVLVTWSKEGVQPGVGGLASREEYTRGLRKKLLFVQINLASLTSPSVFTGTDMGTPQTDHSIQSLKGQLLPPFLTPGFHF